MKSSKLSRYKKAASTQRRNQGVGSSLQPHMQLFMTPRQVLEAAYTDMQENGYYIARSVKIIPLLHDIVLDQESDIDMTEEIIIDAANAEDVDMIEVLVSHQKEMMTQILSPSKSCLQMVLMGCKNMNIINSLLSLIDKSIAHTYHPPLLIQPLIYSPKPWGGSHYVVGEIIGLICEKGVDINEMHVGVTAMHLAVQRECHTALSAMLNHGGNPYVEDMYGRSLVDMALLISNNCSIALFLMSIGVSPRKWLSVKNAIKLGYAACVQYFLLWGIDRNQDGSDNLLLTICEYYKGYCPGHHEILNMVLQQQGIDINYRNAKGESALLHAACSQNHHLVMQLLSHGASLDTTDLQGKLWVEYLSDKKAILPYLSQFLKNCPLLVPFLETTTINYLEALGLAVVDQTPCDMSVGSATIFADQSCTAAESLPAQRLTK